MKKFYCRLEAEVVASFVDCIVRTSSGLNEVSWLTSDNDFKDTLVW